MFIVSYSVDISSGPPSTGEGKGVGVERLEVLLGAGVVGVVLPRLASSLLI